VRTLSYLFLSGNMGDGLAVLSNNDPLLEWKRIEPNSMMETLWTIACGKLVFHVKSSVFDGTRQE
jgi:hypothetical protein